MKRNVPERRVLSRSDYTMRCLRYMFEEDMPRTHRSALESSTFTNLINYDYDFGQTL